jgi:hypothetical protein
VTAAGDLLPATGFVLPDATFLASEKLFLAIYILPRHVTGRNQSINTYLR